MHDVTYRLHAHRIGKLALRNLMLREACPIMDRLQGLACVAVDRPICTTSHPTLFTTSLRQPIPLMQYKTRTHEADCAGNGQKMSRRDLSEVYFEKSTL